MRLILQNGYPYPFPEGLTPEQTEDINERAPERLLTLFSVAHFEWKHTVTVEFSTHDIACAVQASTGWKWWDETRGILEAETSTGDGYGHPAIIVNDTAYCGFILKAD